VTLYDTHGCFVEGKSVELKMTCESLHRHLVKLAQLDTNAMWYVVPPPLDLPSLSVYLHRLASLDMTEHVGAFRSLPKAGWKGHPPVVVGTMLDQWRLCNQEVVEWGVPEGESGGPEDRERAVARAKSNMRVWRRLCGVFMMWPLLAVP